MSRTRNIVVAAVAACGVGLLGTAVQGIAAVDDDLAAAIEEQRTAPPAEVIKRDCPKPDRPRRISGSVDS